MSKKFLRRSLLYVPGSSERKISKAVSTEADAVIFDLEDSVSPAEKEAARNRVCAHIAEIKATGKEPIVRVNAMDSMWGVLDILAVAKAGPDTILIPKADEKAMILADGLLSAAEAELGLEKNTMGLIALFETAYSIASPLSILMATARIDGAQLGAEDLTKEMEIARTPEGTEITYARHQLVVAARSVGIDIMDTPYTGIRDLDGLQRDAQTAKKIGYTGKTCIHPDHIAVVNTEFSPSEAEVLQARGILEAYEASVIAGNGACMYQNKMIDAPIADRARRIVHKAERIAQLRG